MCVAMLLKFKYMYILQAHKQLKTSKREEKEKKRPLKVAIHSTFSFSLYIYMSFRFVALKGHRIVWLRYVICIISLHLMTAQKRAGTVLVDYYLY